MPVAHVMETEVIAYVGLEKPAGIGGRHLCRL